MRLPYYSSLSRRDQAIYRESDEWGSIELEDPRVIQPHVGSLERALAADDRIEVERLSVRIVRALCRQLDVVVPATRILDERPSDAYEELHGLYMPEEDGRGACVLVWMRTAMRERPVAFRTFVRTLLHEVCHHLDYELLELADSFHTHGFFQRESSLVRQLLPAKRPERDPQLELF